MFFKDLFRLPDNLDHFLGLIGFETSKLLRFVFIDLILVQASQATTTLPYPGGWVRIVRSWTSRWTA
jgi:hypothetical protein